MGPPRTVLNTKRFYIITEFSQSGGCRAAGKAGSDHDNFKFSLIGRVDQFQFKTMSVPFFLDRATRDFPIKLHLCYLLML